MEKKGKIIVFSAPSGSGKSTIIKEIRKRNGFPFVFSVSATNRPPREGEQHGVDYYFLTDGEFKKHLDNGDFVETCEVYPGRYYGTLKSEVELRLAAGENVVLDVDVEGGLNVKKVFGNDVLSIFIMPPSIAELRRRLENRGTDSLDKIEERLARADYEISLAGNYDVTVENNELDTAVEQCEQKILDFFKSQGLR